MTNGGKDMLLYGIILAPVAVLAVIALCTRIIAPFSQRRAYIKTEMCRAYDKREYRYWKKELKKLYLEQIPFIGKLLAERVR